MNIYGSLIEADNYFSERLGSYKWETSINNDRTKALIMATRAIDRLNFAGNKNNENQELQFPRGVDLVVPEDIKIATYEIALKLLEGIDRDRETNQIGIVNDSISGTRLTYSEGYVAEHIRAGIPSIEAWYRLKPYLRDVTQIEFSRVS